MARARVRGAGRSRRLAAAGLLATSLLGLPPHRLAAQRLAAPHTAAPHTAAPHTAAPRPHLAFERIAQDGGLSNGTVTAIAQGRAGFLWFGTEDGLNRYDGSGFTLYRTVAGDSTSLADAWVTGLMVGRGGSLWVATLRGGLHRLLPGGRGFRRYRNVPGDAQSLSSDQVNAIHEAPDGALWLGTVRGLDRLDPGTGRVRRYTPVPGDTADVANDVLAVTEDAAGRLWAGTRRGLFLVDPASGRFERQDVLGDTWLVRALLRDRAGLLWVGTEKELIALDPATRAVRVRHHPATPARPSPFSGRVTALSEGPDGTLWVGSDDGLAALDPVAGTYVRHRYDPKDPRSLGGDIVRSVLVDRGGVLWVGLESYGVSKYAPAAVHFDLVRHDPSSPLSLSNGYVRGISSDRRGDLWIATQLGGLNRLDPRSGRVTVYRHRAGDARSLPGDNVWALLEDHAGTTWVGLHEQGLGTFDPRTGAFTRSGLVPRDASVNLLYEDRAGALLVGLEARGLYEISPDRRHVKVYGATVGEPVLVHDDVQAVLEDREGVLWVGGAGGLTRLDRRSGRADHLRGVRGVPGVIGSDFVTNVVEDSRGTVWVATKGGGISSFDRRSGRFTTLGTADGLPHSFVYGILEDARGNLWLSTDDGIARLDPRTRAVTRYGLEDGLQAREFNRRAFHRAADGTMYFGGINGVNVFRPDDAAAAPPLPPVTLLSLRVGSAPSRLAVRLTVDSVVELRPGETSFALSFAALDFTAPEKVRYAYRLEGVDRDWVSAGHRTEASYASLPPGRYVFRVRAANASGLWSPEDAGITVVVAPPWWGTWWARALAVLLLVGLPVAAARIRLRAARRRSALLERRVDEQTRDLTEAQARLRAALEREREAARELLDITAAVPGAVFQLREAPGGRRSFPFVSEGIARLCHDAAPPGAAPGRGVPDDGAARGRGGDDPRLIAEWLVTRLHPPDRQAVERWLAASRETLSPWRAEVRWSPEAGGEVRWLAMRARPCRLADGATVWTGVMMDATTERRAEEERAALEAKVLQAQKAESLGILAGGMAHDFNNLLVGVLASADLLRYETPLTAEAAETVGHIRTSALRAAELTQQMLAYAGKGRLVVERVDVAELVRDMLALLRSAVPRTIALDFDAGAAPAVVEADATQLRQVVMNLVTNASEAIGGGPGRVAVRVAVDAAPRGAAPEGDVPLLHAAPDMPEQGPFAVLEVSDDGCGMDAALLGRIFDPFYSTKFTGRGLGLAALLGIVRAHHGGLHVITAPGRGARFLVYLPLAASAGECPAPAASADSPAAPVAPTCVLVVDDEEAVRVLAGRVLRKLGYDVVAAADGAAALEAMAAAARGERPIDLVLMDVTMPTMDGPTTARAMRATGVTAPIVLTSGYAEEDLVARGVMNDADAFLKKPFAISELAAVLGEVVSRQRR